MKSYSEFKQQAIDNYISLPQESNTLYKRHHVALPDIDIAKLTGQFNDSKARTRNMSSIEKFAKAGINFDIVFSNGSVINKNEAVEIVDCEKYDEMGKRLYGNEEDKYASFIHAYATKAILINVKESCHIVSNIFISDSLPVQIFVKLEKNSSLKLFEYSTSSLDDLQETVCSTINEIELGDNASMELNTVHNEAKNAVVIGFCRSNGSAGSSLNYNSFYCGGSHTRVRNDISVNYSGAKANVNEIVIGSDSQKFDISTYIKNNYADTEATLHSKSALMDSSFCILKGFAKIVHGAKMSKSFVKQASVLIDNGARSIALPDMSIDEMDVKATHSAATGPIDPETIFYLMSRGIQEKQAKQLIAKGFLTDIISRMNDQSIKETSASIINERLNRGAIGITPEIGIHGIWNVDNAIDASMFAGHYKYS